MAARDDDRTRARTTTPDLAGEFEAVTYDAWRAEAERLLQGAPFAHRMRTPTPEGITLEPLYTRRDTDGLDHVDSLPGSPPFVRGGRISAIDGGNWRIAQERVCPTSEEANRALREDLESGQTAVILPVDTAGRLGVDPDRARPGDVGRDGVSICCVDDLARALDGIDLAQVPVFLRVGVMGLPYLGLLVAVAGRQGVTLSHLSGAVAMDPLGNQVRGDSAVRDDSPAPSPQTSYHAMAAMTAWAARHAPRLGTIACHGEPYHDGGGHAVEELGFTLATAVAYLRRLAELGVMPATVASHVRFGFALGNNFFMEIAKLRAARMVWNRVLESCGVPAASRRMVLHARTSGYTKTLYDPHVNLLRATTEALAGVVGGVDSLHVAPFDELLRPPHAFSHRLARNIQLIIRDEAHLGKIQDPAGGSWYVERLTGEVAQAAWKLLQEVERRGGMEAALAEGFPQERIAATTAERDQATATRRRVIVGTNRYPDSGAPATRQAAVVAETSPADGGEALQTRRADAVQRLRAAPEHQEAEEKLRLLAGVREASADDIVAAVIEAAKHGATIGEIARAWIGSEPDGSPLQIGTIEIAPIGARRGADGFEALRRKVEAHRAGGASLKVFLATLGPVARYMPRLDFAATFFEVGGFEVVRTAGFDASADVVTAALAEEPSVVVICGCDETYVEEAPRVARWLRRERRDLILVLAGRPGEEEVRERLQAAGIDHFIEVRSDVLEVLGEVSDRLGVVS